MAEEASVIHELTSFFDECVEFIPESVYLQPNDEYSQNARFNFKVFARESPTDGVEKWQLTKDTGNEGTVTEAETGEVRSRKGDHNDGEDRREKNTDGKGGRAGNCHRCPHGQDGAYGSLRPRHG